MLLVSAYGRAKPDPSIFAFALRSVRAEASDALFVDDTAGHVDAARRLGMSGHLHTETAGTLARIDEWLG